MILPEINLLLVFSSGVSLKLWKTTGLFDREIGYYLELRKKINSISFLTYDEEINDLKTSNREVNSFNLLYNKNRIYYKFFGLLSPLIFRSEIKKIDYVKTNQISGSWIGVIIKLLYKKRLIIRAGYIPTKNLLSPYNNQKKFGRFLISWAVELLSFSFADLIFVSSISDKEFLVKKYPFINKTIHVINTPIDTKKFINKETEKLDNKILFIGRLSKEKNIDHIIAACSKIYNCELIIIGDGIEKDKLVQMANGDNVKFLGIIPNHKLPDIINEAKVLVLASSYEGTPKVVLEAMSCGIPVIASKIPSVEEIIIHNKNGLLYELGNVEALKYAISLILSDDNLRNSLGTEGRKFVESKYSIENIAELETDLIIRNFQND